MRTSKSTIVSLTGGLGNQLFQLACGLNIAQEEPLYLEWGLGKPRLAQGGKPELTSFLLPANVGLEPKRESRWLASKAAGYMLRMGIYPKRYEKLPGYFLGTRILAGVVTSIYFKRLCSIFPGRDVGYSHLSRHAQGNFIVGYFQSYKWIQDQKVLQKLQSLRIPDENEEMADFKKLAEIERPLIVHIRLGDYKNEDAFGVPSASYYSHAIERMWKTGKFGKIWVFSDEPSLAVDLLPDPRKGDVRWIEEIQNSASKTLEVMRFGQGYVIANSTFSWWGAFLSYSQGARVIAPKPWFKGLPSPKDLIPPHWESEVAW